MHNATRNNGGNCVLFLSAIWAEHWVRLGSFVVGRDLPLVWLMLLCAGGVRDRCQINVHSGTPHHGNIAHSAARQRACCSIGAKRELLRASKRSARAV